MAASPFKLRIVANSALSWPEPDRPFETPNLEQAVQATTQNVRPKRYKISRENPLILVSVAAVLGIVADRVWAIGLWSWLLAGLFGTVWLLLFRLHRDNPHHAEHAPKTAPPAKRCSHLAVISLLGFIAASMALWHHHQWRLFSPNHIGLQTCEGTPTLLAVRGRLIDTPQSSQLPDQKSTSVALSTVPVGVQSKFQLQVQSVRDAEHWVPIDGRINVQVNGHLLGLSAGDRVTAFGKLSRMPHPMNPGERRWSDRDRVSRVLARLDVSYPDCITLLQSIEPTEPSARGLWDAIGYRAICKLSELRTNGLLLLDQFVEAPRNLLAGALLLGARDRVEKDRVEVFFRTGTIHLLAISGLHLGILTWFLFILARNSRYRRTMLIVLMAFSLVYCFLTGLRDPVLRAAVLVHVVCIGMIWRRNVLAYNALAAAAMVVLVFRPAAVFQPGTQLSFLAVATMIWLGLNQSKPTKSPIDTLIERSRTWYVHWAYQTISAMKQLAIVGAMIWLVTLPLVMQQFHLVSPAALLLNVVLTLPITISLLSGFLVMVTGAFAAPIARICGQLCNSSLAFAESCVQTAHTVPGAYDWSIGPTSSWCMVFYLGLLAGVLWRHRARRLAQEHQSTDSNASQPEAQRTTTSWSSALLWLCTWLIVWWTIPMASSWATQSVVADDEMRCTFLSVGHGTCVVLELPGNHVLLYDCGRMGIPETGVGIVSEFLWHQRITHIDGVILSHADADHYNLLPGLLERFQVGQVFVSPVMFTSDSPGVDVLRSSIEAANVPIRTLVTDDVMRFRPRNAARGAAPTSDVSDFHTVELQTLHPFKRGVRGSDNANSIVIEVRYQGKTILLPGDLEPPGLQDVIAETKRDCDVLMAPHHGSLRSLPATFAEWCTPEVVVISGGLDHETLDQQELAFGSLNRHVLHTAKAGAIAVTIANGELQTTSFLPPHNIPSRKFR